MPPEVHALPEFYATPTGRTAARLLRARLGALWPALGGLTVLGLGHAAPYLELWHPGARCLALHVPGPAGTPVRFPAAGPGRSLVAEDGRLPFADLSLDRVLLVHGLEAAESARGLLREVWRCLRDDGRLIVVAPNRRGLWAHLEGTPFGHGQPYSAGQLGRLLRRHLFRVERREAALFIPPFRAGVLLRGAGAWEAAGRALMPRFAGVVLVEAEKDLFAAQPAGAVVVRRRVRALAAG